VLVAFEALLIAGALCIWYALPWERAIVEPALVESTGYGRLPKEGHLTEFESLADLDAELGGPTNYRLRSPVDFSRQKLVRVGWFPEYNPDGKLRYAERFGGQIIFFDIEEGRVAPDGIFRIAQHAWFVVPRSANVATETRGGLRRGDWLV